MLSQALQLSIEMYRQIKMHKKNYGRICSMNNNGSLLCYETKVVSVEAEFKRQNGEMFEVDTEGVESKEYSRGTIVISKQKEVENTITTNMLILFRKKFFLTSLCRYHLLRSIKVGLQ